MINLETIEAELRSRVKPVHKAAKLFDDDDHWQDGDGFLPFAFMDATQKAASRERVRMAFVSENVVGKVIDNEQNGLLGREPDFSAVPSTENDTLAAIREEIESALVKCLNEKEYLKLLKEAFRLAATQERAIIRAFLPTGYIDGNSNIKKQSDLLSAMKMLEIEVLSADKAGVFKDSEFYKPYGVFVSEKDGEKLVEISSVDENGLTRLRLIRSKNGKDDAKATLPTLANYMPEDDETVSDAKPQELGGTILMFEIHRDALIGESVISNQKSVNLYHTMKSRTGYQNGHRDAFGLNAQAPEDDDGNPVEIELGGGQMNFLAGAPVWKKQTNGEAELVGYANASLQIVDPVDPEVFIKGEESEAAAIYRQCCQEHLAISESATVSGKSKEESRTAFEKKLKELKPTFDACGRWLLTVLTYFGAANGGKVKPSDLKNFRFDFNCIVDAGTPSAEIIAVAQLDVKEGRISPETYLSKYQSFEDADAETARLEASESYQLALMKQRFECAQLAKDLGLPAEYVAEVLNAEDEYKPAILTALRGNNAEV